MVVQHRNDNFGLGLEMHGGLVTCLIGDDSLILLL